MKTFKKIISVILVITVLATTCVGFSACSKSSESLSIGEYLTTLIDEFGMYLGDDELTDEIALETAVDWKIVNTSVNLSDNVKKGFVLVTLVKTVGFYDTADLTDSEIADYAADNKYNAFKYSGEKDFNSTADKDETLASIQNAKDIWANPDFEEYENIKYSDDVVDLSTYSYDAQSTSELTVPENANADISDESDEGENNIDLVNDADRDTVVINGEADIKEGQIYVSPTLNSNAANEIYRADKIEYKDGKTYITNSNEDIDIEEFLETAEFSGSEIDDLTTVPIVDGDGNVHYPDETTVSNTSNEFVAPTVSNMSYTPGEAEPEYLGGASGDENVTNTNTRSFSIKFGDLKATVSVGEKSFKCAVSGMLYSKKISQKSVNAKGSIKVSKSLEIKDISCDYDVNLLKQSAYITISGTQVEKDSISASLSAGNKTPYKIGEKSLEDLPETASTVISKTLAEIPIKTFGPVSIRLIVKAKISLEGSVEFVVTTESTYGAELKNGNFRVVKNINRDRDITVNAKVEVTAYVGPAIYVANKNILSVGFEGGIGANYAMILHVYNKNNNEQLYYQEVGFNLDEIGATQTIEKNLGVDVCQDIDVYWILKFTTDDDSYLLKKLKISYSHEFLGKKNASFVDKHIEDGKDVGECTRKYDREATTEETTEPNYSDSIETEKFSSTVNVGASSKINITALPEGYSNSDLVFSSQDSSVATVSKDGTITGVSSGSTIITISTSDSKYSTQYAVNVLENANFNISENKYVLQGVQSI